MKQALALALTASLAVAACHTPEPGYSAKDMPPVARATEGGASSGEAMGDGTGAATDEAAASAPGGASVAPDDGWRVTLEPRLFAAGMRGSVSLEGGGEAVDADFSDLLGSLDLGAGIHAELAPRGSPWTVLLDLSYLSLKEDGKGTVADVSKVDSQIDQLVAEASAALALQPDGLVDLLLGVRYWNLDGDLKSIAVPPADDVSISRRASWLDPLVGLRTRLPLTRDVDLRLRADFAGVGVGSEYSYNLGGLVGWHIDQGLELSAGYFHLYAKYDNDGVLYDIANAGPVVSLAWSL